MKAIDRLLPGHKAMWLTFFASILVAWSVLFAMQAAVDPALKWQGSAAQFLLSLCSQSAADAGLGSAVVMWSLMALAMMAPTAFPALRTYSDLTHTDAAGTWSFAALGGGYLAIWLGFSALAAVIQVWLASAGLLNPLGQVTSVFVNGGLLILAGVYQFSPLKEACLKACQSPLTFFMSHWKPGVSGALQLGLRLGAVCLGCCWALMLLAFVAGTMNLAFMGLAMVLMTLEKLPQFGSRISAPLGVFLIVAGLTVVLLPLVTTQSV
ncbi:hypothetical protein FIV00_02440 [Labrenzia sp. THAF82]|uniref:DUF2182 domain-containing protein n=1 Tax=Labrenzia sp. THAF82 TaxID=2587861 RepID=UPI0012A80942|nr:DUF2182 domain-containing protein [Labrenzia sp. THAF82]QFT29335.1 hypothetical protein FIV00_02440 [Labrenzia sp. THAF82]